jgi:hypothetical protein
MFHTVGMLREILKNYSEDTPLLVYQAPGLVFFDEEGQCIDLRNIFPEEDIFPEFTHRTGDVDYMDF